MSSDSSRWFLVQLSAEAARVFNSPRHPAVDAGKNVQYLLAYEVAQSLGCDKLTALEHVNVMPEENIRECFQHPEDFGVLIERLTGGRQWKK